MIMGILRAIGRAIVAAFKTIGRVATWPLRAIGGLVGGGNPWGMAEVPEVADEANPAAEPSATGPDMEKFWEDLARRVQDHCADCVIEGRLAGPPPSFPRDVRDWLRGIDRDECERVLNAEKTAVCAHLRGIFKLPDVRKLQPLPAVVWPPEPAPYEADEGHPGFLFTAYGAR
jgi:hypothetical protein